MKKPDDKVEAIAVEQKSMSIKQAATNQTIYERVSKLEAALLN